MIIKDYKCKCGHDDFFFADKGGQKGIYCSYCGKWFKWADKDEQNLKMKPYEPKTGHWISMYTEKQSHIKDGMVRESVKCSECDEWLTASDEYDCYGRYCPNCGCRMVEPQERSEENV